MKQSIAVLMAIVSMSAFAETGYWTGGRDFIRSADGRIRFRCEYRVPTPSGLRLYYRVFFDACPQTAEIEIE